MFRGRPCSGPGRVPGQFLFPGQVVLRPAPAAVRRPPVRQAHPRRPAAGPRSRVFRAL